MNRVTFGYKSRFVPGTSYGTALQTKPLAQSQPVPRFFCEREGRSINFTIIKEKRVPKSVILDSTSDMTDLPVWESNETSEEMAQPKIDSDLSIGNDELFDCMKSIVEYQPKNPKNHRIRYTETVLFLALGVASAFFCYYRAATMSF